MAESGVVTAAPVAAALPRAFYLRQLVLLAWLALLFYWLNRFTGLDMWLAGLFYDPVTAGFPLQNSLWLDWVNHRAAKYAVIAVTLALYAGAARRRDGRVLLTALAMTLAPLVVSLLKAASPHSCPWSLTPFGGDAELFAIFGQVSAHPGPGHCFPGGHASGGFALMAGYLGFHATQPRRARLFLYGGLLSGTLMGLGQMVRGAHFLSHNLWSAWVVWAVSLLLFACHDARWRSRAADRGVAGPGRGR